MKDFKKQIKNAIADYVASEGCFCCENTEEHQKAKLRIAKLLRIPKYDDGSGFDFGKYETKSEALNNLKQNK